MVLVTFGFVSPSYADDAASSTGNELATYCNEQNSTASNWKWYVCIAFVDGVDKGLGTGAVYSLYERNPKFTPDEEEKYQKAFMRYCGLRG
jgi:hypothetical protein